jgi:hypothetical protein
LLVRHEGKRQLTVKRDDLHRGSPENPWTAVVAEFASQLRREIGELAERFVSDFSTTGPVERTVSEVALLDVLQPYFSYNVACICGIPSITLEGTPADWRKLREKVDFLAPFGLDWWLSELRPICDQFARAADGDIDREHWRRLYKVRTAYGAEVINGWLGKLFPYTKDFATGKFSRRNDLLDPKVEAEIRNLERGEGRSGEKEWMRFNVPGIRAEELPRGLSQVPFTLTGTTGVKTAMAFLAGPFVVTQDGETGALRPTLGWAVCESAPIEQALIRLAEHGLEPARAGLSWDALRALGVDYVPTDVLRFYYEAAGALIHDENRVLLFRVLPLAEWAEPEWAHQGRTHPGRKKQWEPSQLFRFAESSDGTEVVIQLYCSERKNTGAVFVGHRRDGESADETGQKVARSFTDFLLRALDSGSQPYYRRAGFVPLA